MEVIEVTLAEVTRTDPTAAAALAGNWAEVLDSNNERVTSQDSRMEACLGAAWDLAERYCSYLWGARDSTAVVKLSGPETVPIVPHWGPALSAFLRGSPSVQVLQSGAWQAVQLGDYMPSGLGGVVLAEAGTYRIQGTAGASEIPAAVKEAVIRLAGWLFDAGEFESGSGSQGAVLRSGAAELLRRHVWRC